MTTLETVCGV